MKVHELIEWLKTFEDQDADVLIVEHSDGHGYYDQGGNAHETLFDPTKHVDHVDMRGNKFVKPEDHYYNQRTLLLGAYRA